MKPVTIVGGGLAGLTLGILLRRAGIATTIFEASNYPRHRVCGEFLSGAGARILRTLEVPLNDAVEATRVQLFLGDRALELELPEPAICISRFRLDALLAAEFQNCGGELRIDQRFGAQFSEGVVRASGRRRATVGNGILFGLKAHAVNAQPKADLEMHFKPGQYVGLCQLGGSRANVCGLFHSSQPQSNINQRWRELFRETVGSRSLENVDWDESSFCAVAGLTMEPSNAESEFCIGDAAAMIPPLTGNGMSMAFESASLAAPGLERYCAGKMTWSETLRLHRDAWRRAFARRLRWAALTQRLVFTAPGQRLLYWVSQAVPILPRLLFSRTR